MKTLVQFVLMLVFLAVVGYGLGWLIKDSADRLQVHDQHYCTAIEGHTLAECKAMGR